ncbi:MAG TPA: alpha-glucan family phosphorylase [Candidatus Ozemobacteraceae bacterium]|nr:alpha-glucan family phosphorylase [Candidatus Ozemobacteraceae bacterium]
MKPIRTFVVVPSLPEPLKRLKDMAMNLWWCWNPEAIGLFRRLDPVEWERTYHNPVKMLGCMSQERLALKAQDDGFLAHLERAWNAFQEYMGDRQTWFAKKYGYSEKPVIAYFSAEFGIAESLPLYSGGLGMLAGDHLKSASDLGLPLVGVGLLYRVGYFQQSLDANGWQKESYPENDFHNMAIQPCLDKKGAQLSVEVILPGRNVKVLIWKSQIGRVPLLLLDTDTPANTPADRRITRELYGGDVETRIQQEIVLGIGGLRALHELDMHPTVYHMNEGHSAFLALERIVVAMERHHLNFREALELTRASNVFTTHTPVPAGIDVFTKELMEKYFSVYYPKLGVNWQEFLDLGWQNNTPKGDGFSMAVLALNLCGHANGVSKLHGYVSRKMWGSLYPNVPFQEIPIDSVTNGVHIRSYMSQELSTLMDRYLGLRWINSPGDHTVWQRIESIPPEELWRTHERRRERLVAFARQRLQHQLSSRGAPPAEIAAAGEVLNPETLTIGFARRFATYKRATLLFRDKERLIRILTNKERPVQIIIAGKAHPKDEPGKQFIKDIIQHCKDERIRRHVVFIENYDVVVARYLVQGVDVWLNNPLRPQEASGTSGMKAAANGALNLSVLDGWWDECFNPEVGWAIGGREEISDQNYQDEVDANSLYEQLEKDIVPKYYERSSDGLPRRWIAMMKSCMSQICPVFNTNRMVGEYNDRFYMTGNTRYKSLSGSDYSKVRDLAAWLGNLRGCWNNIRIENVETAGGDEQKVGQPVDVKVRLYLDRLHAKDVSVQVYYGTVGSDGTIGEGTFADLKPVEEKDGRSLFAGAITLSKSGRQGISVRVLPHHPELIHPILTGHILWA